MDQEARKCAPHFGVRRRTGNRPVERHFGLFGPARLRQRAGVQIVQGGVVGRGLHCLAGDSQGSRCITGLKRGAGGQIQQPGVSGPLGQGRLRGLLRLCRFSTQDQRLRQIMRRLDHLRLGTPRGQKKGHSRTGITHLDQGQTRQIGKITIIGEISQRGTRGL